MVKEDGPHPPQPRRVSLPRLSLKVKRRINYMLPSTLQWGVNCQSGQTLTPSPQNGLCSGACSNMCSSSWSPVYTSLQSVSTSTSRTGYDGAITTVPPWDGKVFSSINMYFVTVAMWGSMTGSKPPNMLFCEESILSPSCILSAYYQLAPSRVLL